jgi:predicted CXXCH cytochrome family protein
MATVTGTPVPPPAVVQLTRALSGQNVGGHRAAPQAAATVELDGDADRTLAGAVLSDTYPSSWHLIDAGGGYVAPVDATTSRISWTAREVRSGEKIRATYRLLAPARADPPQTYFFQAALTSADGSATADPWPVTVSSAVVVDHYRVGKDRPPRAMEWYAPVDAPVDRLSRFEAFRVRFQVSNRDTIAARWTPLLEWSVLPDRDFQPVKVDDPSLPFYVRRSSVLDRGDLDELLLALGPGHGAPERGRVYDTLSAAPEQQLGPESYTEIEFNVRATAAAAWQTAYYFRLTDAGTPLSGNVIQLTTGAAPPVPLTQPQYPGRTAAGSERPQPATIRAVGVSPGLMLLAAEGRTATAPADQRFKSPHGLYAPTSDQCATCHRSHSAQQRNVLTRAGSQSIACFTCHNGTGANANVAIQYTDPSIPANDTGASAFYSHPATASSTTHTSASVEEFKGVLNRHSECGDCHSPHRADPTAPGAMTSAGWTASGAEQGISGVRVLNGGGGGAQGYVWQQSIGFEYELCFKCHSGYTTLLSYGTPSDQVLDKGRELNPGNASYHPVEAPGTGSSPQLTANLAGTSPYKLWTFTPGDTVRCLNCHGNYALANAAAPPSAGARLDPHASRYRGLLMNNYQDRQLTSPAASNNYSAANFALCYQCHSEAPFVDGAGDVRSDSNYRFHGFHLTSLYNNPLGNAVASTDINTAGAGQGNAICAECHFRIHSPAAAVNPAQSNNPHLLNFAPNVGGAPLGTAPIWDAATRSCTLTCHGFTHRGFRY